MPGQKSSGSVSAPSADGPWPVCRFDFADRWSFATGRTVPLSVAAFAAAFGFASLSLRV
jgi:hypothetical protein